MNKRLREQRQMYGAQSLSTSELIAAILSGGSAPTDPLTLASRLLEKYGVRGLKNSSDTELVAEGLTMAKARALRVVCELAERLSMPEPGEKQRIRSADEAALLLRPFMAYLEHEEFRVLVLDTKNQVVANMPWYGK